MGNLENKVTLHEDSKTNVIPNTTFDKTPRNGGEYIGSGDQLNRSLDRRFHFHVTRKLTL